MTGWIEQFRTSFGLYLDFFPTQFTEFHWSTPVGMAATAAGLCLLLEAVLPRKREWSVLGRPGFGLDLLYVAWMDLLVFPLGLYALLVATEHSLKAGLAAVGLPDPLPFRLADLPAGLGVAAAFVVLDFAQWAAHYALHRVPALWSVHKVHHAQETLGFGSTRHFHVLEHLVFRAFVWVPALLLGASLGQAAWLVWGTAFLAFLSHCNVRLPWGPLRRWIITPDTHYWHHARDVAAPFGVNFASVLCLWDHLFGTFHHEEREPALGIHHDDVPKGFFGQLAYPFAAWLRPDPGPSFGRPEAGRRAKKSG